MAPDIALCPICNATSQEAFTTTFHRIHRCDNPRCTHLFAVGHVLNQGIISPDMTPDKDYTIYAKRNRHLIQYWHRHGFLKEGSRLLDFGSGTGHIVKSIKELMNIEVTCVEAGTAYHAKLKDIARNVYATLTQIGDAETFDAALMIEVVEHLNQPLEALQQIRQHLKKGGTLFLTTPAGDLRGPAPEPWKLGAYKTAQHIQFFTPKSLTLALSRAGFRHIRYRYVHELYPDDALAQADYESLWVKKYAFLKWCNYWRKGADHLTYFAD